MHGPDDNKAQANETPKLTRIGDTQPEGLETPADKNREVRIPDFRFWGS